MTPVLSQNNKSIQYPSHSIQRAERALRCSPFQFELFARMGLKSVALNSIASRSGVECQWTKGQRSELAVEEGLLWLIQVGVLRREVDGQGITDSFRLTPLGHQLVEKWQGKGCSFGRPSVGDRLSNALNRWLRLPI